MLYGSVLYWHNQPQCSIFETPDGFWKVLIDIGQCDAWVAWIAANAMLHLAWVFMLLICQMYQVSKFSDWFLKFSRAMFIQVEVKWIQKLINIIVKKINSKH